MSYFHQSVLLKEVLEYLRPQANQNFIDGTVGGGGHAYEILKRTSPGGELYGFDRDPKAIAAAGSKLKEFGARVHLFQDNYQNINKNNNYVRQGISLRFSGFLLDLGISSPQVSAEDERGFSFQFNQPLDMRFGPDGQLTASQIVNTWPEEKLTSIFKNYGQEPKARLIAKKIVAQRSSKPISYTSELIDIVNRVYAGGNYKINPATKIFQAIRIAVNDELENLKLSLPEAIKALEPGGRIAVISFHSLEDKIVKEFFKQESIGCVCPKNFPECRCSHQASLKIITKKPIIASQAEIQQNPRSRSAKLRVAEKI